MPNFLVKMKRLLPILTLFLALNSSRADTSILDQVTIHRDLVYGHKMGMALTMDLVQPKNSPNGAATLFMMSGGWVSQWSAPEKLLTSGIAQQAGFTTLLEKGFTLIIVRHGSSPKFLVPEAVSDVREAVRFVKQRSSQYSIDPERLGVFGGSAGGHLSLMLGTTAEKDTRVAAVVAFYPPTDLEPYVRDENFRKTFPALRFDERESDSVSPLRHVTPDDAPTLLIHGNKDKLVPPKHSIEIHQALTQAKVDCDVILFENADHGFAGADLAQAVDATVGWFEKHLLKQP